METVLKIVSAFFISFLCSCHLQNSKPLIAKDETNENEIKNTLFVFVGEKLEVNELPYKKGSIDVGFKAKYRILQRVYGRYQDNVIEIEAYDHYGKPDFLKYKTVLLFVSEQEGKYYHEKYMYNDVYKTKDGRWAGSYAAKDYGHEYNKNTTVKPVKILFAGEVSYPTKVKGSDGKEYKLSYKEPYFKTIGNKAIAIYGNYIEDLFNLKKEGFLTARGLFGEKQEIEIKDLQLAPIEDSAAQIEPSENK